MADETKTRREAQAETDAERKARDEAAKAAEAEAAKATEEARKQSLETEKEQADLRPYPSQEEADRIKAAAADGGNAAYATRQLKP